MVNYEIMRLNRNENLFYAFVKFVGENTDHAFVYKLTDLNKIRRNQIYNDRNPEYNFKLKGDCSNIKINQIILCALKHSRFSLAKIVSTDFNGSVINEDETSFIDWYSFDEPIIFNNISLSNVKDISDSISVQIFYERNGFLGKKIEKEDLKNDLKTKMKMGISHLLEGSDKINQKILNVFKSICKSEEYTSFLEYNFNNQLEEEKWMENETSVISFITKWNRIAPELLNIHSIGRESIFDILFELWLDEQLPINFYKNYLIDVSVKYYSNKYGNSIEKSAIQKDLLRPHREEIGNKFTIYYKNELLIDTFSAYLILKDLTEICAFPINQEDFQNKINNSLSPKLRYQRWVEDPEVESFPDEIKDLVLKNLADLNLEKQSIVLNQLDIDELSDIINGFKPPENEENHNRLLEALRFRLQCELNIISFDIESDEKSIFEIAWNDNFQWISFEDQITAESHLDQFANKIRANVDLIVGQNIIDFDCKVLNQKGIDFDENKIWDTLRVEMFLSPYQKHYALSTKHSAKEDAEFTLDLFVNQLIRILIAFEDDNELIKRFFPENQIRLIEEIQKTISTSWIDPSLLDAQQKKFYRPIPKRSYYVRETLDILKNSEDRLKIILGPDMIRKKFLEQANFKFDNIREELDFQVLSESKIQSNQQLENWLKVVLLSFIRASKKQEIIPYWGKLPGVLRNRLIARNNSNSGIDPFSIVETDSLLPDVPFFLTPEELQRLSPKFENKTYDVVTVLPNLITLTQKKLIRENISSDELREKINDDQFWLTFPRGQSFVTLNPEQYEKFGVAEMHYSNYFVEKLRISHYRIWANVPWESLLEKLPIKNQFEVNESINIKRRTPAYFVKIKNRQRDIIRLNPESLYRAEYWAFQKEILEQIVLSSDKTPCVLLLKDSYELERLEDFFRNIGYYIPRREASLARRLELIQKSRQKKRLLIEEIKDFERILDSNHQGNLNLIWESLNFAGNYQVCKNSRLLERINQKIQLQFKSEVKAIDDFEKTDSNSQNTYLHLSLNKPKLDFFRNLLSKNTEETGLRYELWVLDSRIEEFPNLAADWGASVRTISLPEDDKQYKRNLEIARNAIGGVQSDKEIPFSKEETIDKLADLFLPAEYSWYSEQIPYLELIISGTQDQLVTLPTGGGKSLLFQAPALFKSAFTNRLTIVVTPLKALMEDQVIALQNKGFIGSVDYINSDRGSDVNVIYKSIASGEISLLYITPERFRSRSFMNVLHFRMQMDGRLEYAVFDEAHCISQWGHEFRPDYFNSAKVIKNLKKETEEEFPLLLFSATISSRIFEDIKTIFYD